MPFYEYRCAKCGEISTVHISVEEQQPTHPCDNCSASAQRVISRPSVHLSKTSKLERLDPKYDKMVDRAMRSTPLAEPDRLLKKLKPFSEGK